MVDHGGLLVAADDYHKDSSTVIKYSCNEGISWRNYTYTNVAMTVYGVITEPGEETTTVRYYCRLLAMYVHTLLCTLALLQFEFTSVKIIQNDTLIETQYLRFTLTINFLLQFVWCQVE